jgi:hypothetical protein
MIHARPPPSPLSPLSTTHIAPTAPTAPTRCFSLLPVHPIQPGGPVPRPFQHPWCRQRRQLERLRRPSRRLLKFAGSAVLHRMLFPPFSTPHDACRPWARSQASAALKHPPEPLPFAAVPHSHSLGTPQTLSFPVLPASGVASRRTGAAGLIALC